MSPGSNQGWEIAGIFSVMNPKLVIAFALLLALVLVLGTGPGRALLGIRDGYEEAPYTVLRQEGRFELRRYEELRIARTQVEPRKGRPENEGFRRLAGYIFGGNTEDQKIAMTTPVFTDQGEGMTMTFVLPARWSLASLPKPKDARVELTVEPPRAYAVARFSGVAYPEDLDRRRPELERWMEAQGITATGPARMAFYDPPWTIPFLRRNEVLIPVSEFDEA